MPKSPKEKVIILENMRLSLTVDYFKSGEKAPIMEKLKQDTKVWLLAIPWQILQKKARKTALPTGKLKLKGV